MSLLLYSTSRHKVTAKYTASVKRQQTGAVAAATAAAPEPMDVDPTQPRAELLLQSDDAEENDVYTQHWSAIRTYHVQDRYYYKVIKSEVGLVIYV